MDERAKYKGATLTKRGDYQIQVYDKSSQLMKYLKRTTNPVEVAKVQGAAMAREKTAWYTKECMIKRFKLCMQIYTNHDGSPAIMSDLIASVDAMKDCPLLSVCCPALYYMSLLGKDGPWKKALSICWSKAFDMNALSSLCGRHLRIRSLQHVEPHDLAHEDLMALARILQQTAGDAWRENREAWDLNVGRNKLYFMGWQRMVVIIGSKGW